MHSWAFLNVIIRVCCFTGALEGIHVLSEFIVLSVQIRQPCIEHIRNPAEEKEALVFET